jgi:hypothetical protein
MDKIFIDEEKIKKMEGKYVYNYWEIEIKILPDPKFIDSRGTFKMKKNFDDVYSIDFEHEGIFIFEWNNKYEYWEEHGSFGKKKYLSKERLTLPEKKKKKIEKYKKKLKKN